MLYLSCHKYVKLQFKLCYRLSSCPVKWNYGQKQVDLLAGSQLRSYKIATAIYYFHLLFLLMCSLFSNKVESVTSRLVRWNNFFLFLASALFNYGTWQSRDDLAFLINCLKKFEIMRMQKRRRSSVGTGKISESIILTYIHKCIM